MATVPLSFGLPAMANTPQLTGNCSELTTVDIPRTELAAAKTVTNERGQEFCEVRGVIEPQTRFAVRLPISEWTGQYVQLDCGGPCGAIPELDLPLFGFRCPAALAGTMVLAADDTGHTVDPQGHEPATWGNDPRLRLEFGLLSEHRLRWVTDRVIKAY